MSYQTVKTGAQVDAALDLANTAVQPARQVAATHSLTGGGDLSADRTLSLVGDTATPGANQVYGTNASGVRGWKPDPAGGGSPAGSGTEVQYRDGTSFGAMSGTAWDNAARTLTITGATVTASNPVLNLSQTWNNASVAFVGFGVNVTRTAAQSGSSVMRLNVNGSDAFSVNAIGGDSVSFVINAGVENNRVIIGNHIAGDGFPGIWLRQSSTSYTNYAFLADGATGVLFNGPSNAQFRVGNSTQMQVVSGDVRIAANTTFGFSSTVAGPGRLTNTPDVAFARDAAGRVGVRVGGSPQSFGVYNTESGSLANFERLNVEWVSNVAYIRPSAAGTGTVRPLIVRHPPVTLATLPSAATAGAGARSVISDATATTFASVAAGGGSNTVPVYSDGTDWRIG